MPSLNSTNLASAEYDDETSELTIEFQNGSTYVYSAVPRQAYEALLAAPSPGRYFASAIRDTYQFRRG